MNVAFRNGLDLSEFGNSNESDVSIDKYADGCSEFTFFVDLGR